DGAPKSAALTLRGHDRPGLSNRRNLRRTRANRPRMAVVRDRGLRHPCAEEVAGALGKHVTVNRSRFVTHPARQIAQSQTKPGVIEITRNRARHDRLELSDVGILPPLVAEVFPRRVARTDSARNVYGEAF